MAYEVSRRSFLKGAAALAVATAASGLLTACGGGKDDGGFAIGDNFKVYFGTLDFGTSDANGKNYIDVKVKVECTETKKWVSSKKLSDVFVPADANVELYNKNETFEKMTRGDMRTYEPHFVMSDDLYKQYMDGKKDFCMTINLYGEKSTFNVNLPKKTISYTVKQPD